MNSDPYKIYDPLLPCLILIVVVVCFVATFMWKCPQKLNRVLVPAHVSLDTAKYKILKEDSLTINDMKIKRVYYLVKK